MARRLYPHKCIKYWYVYDIDDICTLFAEFGLHVQTVRKWVKDGLKTIDKGKPALIYGNDLIDFLKAHNSKNKCQTLFNEMFCVKCQDARKVYQRKVKINHKQGFLHVSGICSECKSTMFKSYKIKDWPELKRIFQVVDILQLYDCEDSTTKTHLQPDTTTPTNESSYGTPYGDLFG